MYYILSKADEAGKRTVLATDPQREGARQQAKALGGVVRNEKEYLELAAADHIDDGASERAVEANNAGEGTGQRSGDLQAAIEAGTQGNPTGDTGDTPPEHNRRATDSPEHKKAVEGVVQHAQKVATAAVGVALEAAALLDGNVDPSGILAAAKKIAKTPRVRKTVGAKAAAEPKRPPTDEGVLLAANEFLKTLAQPEAKKSKVQIVRELALWQGKKLQRRDVFELVKNYPVDLGIAPATISTQFQFARSGKEKQNA